ncbi:hypothetical protein BH24ACT21_BH24ACT21_10950 [soil metagenome]|jgi:predicted methyltransferase
MGEQQSRLEKIVSRIEERIEEWRQEDAARKMEADANREVLWAEAVEREKMLADAISEEEVRRESVEEVTKKQKLVFVVHTDEVAETLQTFADEGDRLVKIMPGKGTRAGDAGLSGSWLAFEAPED